MPPVRSASRGRGGAGRPGRARAASAAGATGSAGRAQAAPVSGQPGAGSSRRAAARQYIHNPQRERRGQPAQHRAQAGPASVQPPMTRRHQRQGAGELQLRVGGTGEAVRSASRRRPGPARPRARRPRAASDDGRGQDQHPPGRQAAPVPAAAPTTSSAPNPAGSASGAASPRRRRRGCGGPGSPRGPGCSRSGPLFAFISPWQFTTDVRAAADLHGFLTGPGQS